MRHVKRRPAGSLGRSLAAVVTVLAVATLCGASSSDPGRTEVLGARLEAGPVPSSPADPSPPAADLGAPAPMNGASGGGSVAALPAELAPPGPDTGLVLVAPGVYTERETVDGRSRSWTVVVPQNRPAGKVPALVVLHGRGATGEAMRAVGLDPLAAADGVVTVYPDAVDGSWNDGRPGMEPLVAGSLVDDDAFLTRLLRRLTERAGVDPERIAIAGFSNGALMASRLACAHTDLFSAAVLVAGAGGADFAERCAPARPLPVLVVGARRDPVVPYDGGAVAPAGNVRRGVVASTADVVNRWAARNGCASRAERAVNKEATEIDGVQCAGAPVVHYRLDLGVHEWRRSAAFDTTREAWGFVREQWRARTGAPGSSTTA